MKQISPFPSCPSFLKTRMISLTLALDWGGGGGVFNVIPPPFTQDNFPVSIFWGWVGPGVVLDRVWREEYSLFYEESNPQPVHTVSSRYTDYYILPLRIEITDSGALIFIDVQINQPTRCINLSDLLPAFKYSSTCFGHPHAHHQELINYSSYLWFTVGTWW
jgi:hypothetical protein